MSRFWYLGLIHHCFYPGFWLHCQVQLAGGLPAVCILWLRHLVCFCTNVDDPHQLASHQACPALTRTAAVAIDNGNQARQS